MDQIGDLFIPRPWLALIPVLALAALYRVSRGRLIGLAAVAWLAYAFLEFGNYMRWTCSGECDIRIDLLVIYPVLILLTFAALVSAVASIAFRRRRSRASRRQPFD